MLHPARGTKKAQLLRGMLQAKAPRKVQRMVAGPLRSRSPSDDPHPRLVARSRKQRPPRRLVHPATSAPRSMPRATLPHGSEKVEAAAPG
eukprot:scaffold55567_cov28-Tisochrysis_lutea.AAC.9